MYLLYLQLLAELVAFVLLLAELLLYGLIPGADASGLLLLLLKGCAQLFQFGFGFPEKLLCHLVLALQALDGKSRPLIALAVGL